MLGSLQQLLWCETLIAIHMHRNLPVLLVLPSLHKDCLLLISDQHDPRLSEQRRLQLRRIQQITQTQVIVPKTYRKRYRQFLANPKGPSCSSWTRLNLFFPICPDDADAGEIKKSHKSVRRRQREAASNQKQEEATKRQWESHRSSVSSHSSGDEVSFSSGLPVLCTAAQ